MKQNKHFIYTSISTLDDSLQGMIFHKCYHPITEIILCTNLLKEYFRSKSYSFVPL